MTPTGLPHSDTHGSKLESSSPWIFAGFRVLHRLLVPRHPPCALCSLTIVEQGYARRCRKPPSMPAASRRAGQMGRVRGSFRQPRTHSLSRPSLSEANAKMCACWLACRRKCVAFVSVSVDRSRAHFRVHHSRSSGGLVQLFDCQIAIKSSSSWSVYWRIAGSNR